MNFDERLQKAIQRGHRRSEKKTQKQRHQALSAEELKRLHSQHRLKLSECIENCLQNLPHHFPGFQYETIYGDRGWGAACKRDDLSIGSDGQRDNHYSRLEMTIRPFSSLHVIDLAAKGTIRNKELFNRNYYEKIQDVDPQKFVELIDVWVLEYAEMFAASS